MRSILRFILLNLFIVSFVGLIELLLLRSLVSSPVKIKTLLSDAHVYTDLTVFINKRLQDSGESFPVTISETTVSKVIETLIDDTWEWVTGRTNRPPSISLSQLLSSSGVSKQELSELSTMQDELMKAMADPELVKELPSDSQEGMKTIKDFAKNGNAISLESKLVFLKTLVNIVRVGIPVLSVLSIIDLLLILLLSTNNQSRSMWMFFTFLLTSGAFLVGAVIFALPKIFIPILLSQSESSTSYGEGVLRVIIGPMSNVLFHEHLAIAVGVFCVAIVCLLARIMVFRGNPAVMVETTIQKKKLKNTTPKSISS